MKYLPMMQRKWERIYLEEGKEGLYIERRGRKSTGRPAKLKKEMEEDLISDVQLCGFWARKSC